MDIRSSVKCIAPDHPRVDQAGIVVETDGKKPPKSVVVRWDIDQADESTPVTALLRLAQN